ncbi:MAG: DNA polymerase III subunit alpha, partial [Deltaproteobacteria bacterium]|nr:DNA polymerase III subunit alpha [Deltaproteobacteria bacterium]
GKELVESREDYGDLFDYAARLQGLARQTSVHAAGVVIADRPLTEYVPLYRGANGVLVPQYDMEEIGSLGLIKFDLLGLTALTRMKAAEDLIRERHKKNFRYTDIPLDDPKTFELMGQGNTAGIFQFESRGMRELLRKMKPDRIEDLIAANALYRPGPLGMKTNEVYIRRKHGSDPVTYKHPLLEDILKETYGTIVYQEQVMNIATAMGGFTMGEADVLRHAMGKKKQDKIRSMRNKFREGAVKKDIPEAIAAEIYDEMVPFGEYGFNKSHSAAYAIFAYMTAYIKVHYPVEFFATLLNSELGDNDKISRFIREARAFGMNILPPDVNNSGILFEISGEKEIRYALSAIKNIGGAADMIAGARREGAFISFGDFLERVDLSKVNRRVIESLIKCGAFDSMGYTRASLMNSIDRGFEYAAMKQREKASGQLGIFGSSGTSGTEGVKAADFVAKEREWDEKMKLTFEKEVMGFFFSGHPLDHYMQETERLGVSLIQDLDVGDGERVSVFGLITARQEKTSKDGSKYAKLTIEDPTGSLEVMVFRKAYQKWEKVRDSDEPLIFSGMLKVREDQENVYRSLFADDFTVLSAASKNMISEVKIYLDADSSG